MDKKTNNNQQFTQIPNSLMADKNLTDQDKLTLGLILSFIKNKKEVFMGNEYIAKHMGITKNAASIRIKRLEKLGCIKVRYTYKEGKKEVDKRYITLLSLTPTVSSDEQEVSSTKRDVSSDRREGIVSETKGYRPTDERVSSKLGGIIQGDNTSVLNNLKDKVLDKVLNKQNSFEKGQILSLLQEKFEDSLATDIKTLVESGGDWLTPTQKDNLNENKEVIVKKLPVLKKYLKEII